MQLNINILSFTDSMTAIRGFFALAILFQLGAIIYPPFYKQMASGIVKLEFMAILCLIASKI